MKVGDKVKWTTVLGVINTGKTNEGEITSKESKDGKWCVSNKTGVFVKWEHELTLVEDKLIPKKYMLYIHSGVFSSRVSPFLNLTAEEMCKKIEVNDGEKLSVFEIQNGFIKELEESEWPIKSITKFVVK